jgi:hypothetical protein
MEEEIESRKIEIYGNISPEKFGDMELFSYLCTKYEE